MGSDVEIIGGIGSDLEGYGFGVVVFYWFWSV